MKCLLKYKWIKLPRNIIPNNNGIMGHWAKLASRVAFRNGQASYCGYINEVKAGSWSGGIVGIKSILGVKSRKKAFSILEQLQSLGYIKYSLDIKTKKLTYEITDWVVNCSGEPCLGKEAIYTTEGFGFLCVPRNITEHLVEMEYVFDEADAWLDLWCHTVWNDSGNAFSQLAPIVQFGRYGIALTLDTLGKRWKWEKTKVWRFIKKTKIFMLQKLPGAYGCLIFNTQYPTEQKFIIPNSAKIKRILDDIRLAGINTHLTGTDNFKINHLLSWHSNKIITRQLEKSCPSQTKNRVANLGPIIRAYFSLCNCMICIYDCVRDNNANPFSSVYSSKLDNNGLNMRGG